MRVALAGISHWHAGMHARAVAAAGAKVVGIWDCDPAARRRFAAASGADARPSLAALLADRPDLVVAMGRADRMPELVGTLMDARVPIVMEKPAALSATALAPLAARARREGHFVAVPLPNRFSPIWAAVQSLRADGRLGTISHAQFRIVNGPPARYRRDGVGWVLDPALHGGGALRNLGIHGIDAALALAGGTGDHPEIVGAALEHRLYGEPVEEYAAVTLRLADGIIAIVEAGYTFASMADGGEFEWRISAANASLVDRGDRCCLATLDDGAEIALAPLLPSARYDTFMSDTLRRLAGGSPPAAGIEDYASAMRLIDRIYEESGR